MKRGKNFSNVFNLIFKSGNFINFRENKDVRGMVGRSFLLLFCAVLLVLSVIFTVSSGQHPLKKDSDGDGIPDGWELEHGLDPNDASDASKDYNYNGLTNLEEYKREYDPFDPDTDDDGISNLAETTGMFGFRTDPLSDDTDGDGLSDLDEIIAYIDTGNETQMSEIKPGENDREKVRSEIVERSGKIPSLYRLDPTNSDTDGDGLSDGDEISAKTNPTVKDSDGDGLSDGEEVSIYGTDPAEADSDGDGLLDAEEIYGTYGVRTDPTKADTDGDGIPDKEEVLGFENAPIPPSRYALSFEEFLSSSAYTNETITLKGKIEKILHNSGLDNYSILLISPNETFELGVVKKVIVRVESSWHYDIYHDFVHVDDRFHLALREGDTIFVVGVAKPLRGSIREIFVGSEGAIYLVLSPEEMIERWQPSRDHVKVMRVFVSSSPSPSPSPPTTPSPTSPSSSPSPNPPNQTTSPSTSNASTSISRSPSPSNASQASYTTENASAQATAEGFSALNFFFLFLLFAVCCAATAVFFIRRRRGSEAEARVAKEGVAEGAEGRGGGVRKEWI